MNILGPMRAARRCSHQLGQLTGECFNRIGYVSENQELPDGMTVGGMLDYFRPFYPTWTRRSNSSSYSNSICRSNGA